MENKILITEKDNSKARKITKIFLDPKNTDCKSLNEVKEKLSRDAMFLGGNIITNFKYELITDLKTNTVKFTAEGEVGYIEK